MPSVKTAPFLIVILGPTGVGKTEISLQLAERVDGEIISADSRLFYRGMDIGTAKPSVEEISRVPHHLIDVAEPDQIWSLAMFQREAHRIITEIHLRKRVPFLVGGTGQYIRAVTEEWQIPEAPPNFLVREALENWANDIGSDGLHQRLSILDPDAAARIDPRNLRRTIRALEVIFQTGEQFSDQQSRGPSRYRLVQLGLTRPRANLYARIDSRIEAMLDAGFEGEVRNLLDAGYSPELASLSAIGYRQIADYIKGDIDIDEAIMLMKRKTRLYVRRQANWFKLEDPNIQWFQAGPEAADNMEIAIQVFLRA
ncbi:tRNA (adenosine(37)-N6)-dimethylallyltransferase MiaA [Chloroflexota bacterium]